MGYLEAEWMRYWLDVYEGKYSRTETSEAVLVADFVDVEIAPVSLSAPSASLRVTPVYH